MDNTRIDLHMHYLPPAYYELLARHKMTSLDGGMRVPEWSRDFHLDYMEQLGISYTLTHISSPHVHMGDKAEAIETARACNEQGAEFMRDYPDKIGIAASLPIPEIEESIEEIRYCREELGINAFAFITNSLGVYLGDPRLDPVFEEINKRPTIVTMHPTAPSAIPDGIDKRLVYPAMEFFFDTTRAVANMVLNNTINKFPNVRFIVPHAGAYVPILSDRLYSIVRDVIKDPSIDVYRDLGKLYYDLAGMSMPKQLGVLRLLVDDERIVYGSDGGFSRVPLSSMLKKEMDEKLTPDLQELYYRQNPKKLLEECR